MLQVHAFHSDREHLPQPTIWSGQRKGNRLDCETGALLRQVIAPLFAEADTWHGLRKDLTARGFDLRFEDGRLILIETVRGTKICSCRFLGHPLASLAQRLGKLRARPPHAGTGFGQLVA
ncbi:hypothetical protein ACS3SW_14305 [Roseobacteraceae bacterium S113]